MYGEISFFTAERIAVFVLTFILGLLVSRFMRSKGFSGCLVYIVIFVVLIVVVTALYKGYSVFIERITFTLTEYIYTNFAGFIGFVIGFLIGMIRRQ